MSCMGSAFAASTAELKVIGKVVPAACTPSFAGGSVVDYGDIDANTLNTTTGTDLGWKSTSFNIACSAPLKIAVRFTDSRAATKPDTDARNYGLGLDGAAKVGSYDIFVKTQSIQADGGDVQYLLSWDKATWSQRGAGIVAPTGYFSFANVGETTPAAFKTYSADLDVIAKIAPGDTLDLSKDVPLDGLATLEVEYL